MQYLLNRLLCVLCTLSLIGSAYGAGEDFAGKWTAEFDTQIGTQKYTFDFKVDGDKLTGTAIGVREMGTNEVTITEGKVGTNDIFFVEQLQFGDQELRIEYKGKLAGDEIKLTRQVGDVATEHLVAKRITAAEAKADAKLEAVSDTNPETKSEEKSEPAKP